MGGQWNYLFRAIDKHGQLIDFMLLDRRNTHAVYQFLGKALKTNNIIEADHGGIKRVIRPTRGFQTMRTAYAIIKGFEIMRMI